MQIHFTSSVRKHDTNNNESSLDLHSVSHGFVQGDSSILIQEEAKERENAGQNLQESSLSSQTWQEDDQDHSIIFKKGNQDCLLTSEKDYSTQHDVSNIVFTPRVPGEDMSSREFTRKNVSPTFIRETLENSDMALRVPKFLKRMTRSSREGGKALLKVRPCTQQGDRRQTRTIRWKSCGPGIVTVPVSAKQWLLQAIGLKDTEIYELFNQMETMPQFASEYIREVKEEWKALESRGMKKPPEAEFLLKDQALLEKVKSLIVRFATAQQLSAFDKQQECQILKGPEHQTKLAPISGEKKLPTLQDDWKVDKGISKSDEVDDSETHKLFCSVYGQLKPTTSKMTSQKGFAPTTYSGQRSSSPQLRHVLPSFIPVDDYIIKQCIVQPETHGKMEHKSRFSPFDKRWYTVLFPAIQPGRREDVQLLGEWLQHATQKNHCEAFDGHFEDTEAAFLLHSIAFLEIVRQVELNCEERGNLLLHVWRQILRVFNQVMARAEPFLDAKEGELRHMKNHTDTLKEQISHLIDELDHSRNQLKDKEIQMQKFKRCRLCLCENMTPRSREDVVRKVKIKAATHKRVIQFSHLSAKDDETHETPKRTLSPTGGSMSQGHSVREEDGPKSSHNLHTHVDKEGEISGVPQTAHLMELDEGKKSATLLAMPPDIIEKEVPEVALKEYEQEKLVSDATCVDSTTQTSKSSLDTLLMRCQSAPGRLQSMTSEIPCTINLECHKLVPSKTGERHYEKKTEEDAEFLKLLGPPAPGSIPIPGTIIGAAIDRLQQFETLALETLSLLEKIQKTDGDIASTVQTLTENYCRMTGYVLKKPEKEDKEMDILAEAEADGQHDNEPDVDKGKKKGQKPGKTLQAKFYVPTSFSKMMKINSVPKNLKSFNVRQVTKLIASVYAAKIEADVVDDAANNERQSCSEFVYDFMLNLYGLKGIAESAIHGLFKTIKSLITSKQMDKHHKVRLFSKFVGIEGDGYNEPDLYLYLKVLQRAMGKACALLPSEQDDGLIFLNLAFLDFILDEPNLVQFVGSEAAAREIVSKFITKNTIVEKASAEIKKLVKENEVKKVDWDHMMETILESRPRTNVQVQETKQAVQKQSQVPLTKEKLQELESLFIAGDANQDGVLTFTEFREIISTADPSISTQSALRMFRETLLLMPDGGDSISPQAFATIAHSHGINAPPSVVFDLLKKTWDQVQPDINEEKMREPQQKAEFEGLRQSLLLLLAEQKNVSDAVQLFRSIVLKFCGGNEEEETAEQDVSAMSESGDVTD